MKFTEYYEKELSYFPSEWASHFLEYSELRAFIEKKLDSNSVDLLRSFPKGYNFMWSLSASTPLGYRSKGTTVAEDTEAINNSDIAGQDADTADFENFEAMLSTRLSALALNVPVFIKMLDANILTINTWYKTIAQDIIAHAESYLASAVPNSAGATELCKEIKLKENDLTSLQEILSRLYVLEEFLIINFIATFKLLKRFDKHSGLRIRGPYVMRLTHLFGPFSNSLLHIKTRITSYLSLFKSQNTSTASSSLDENSENLQKNHPVNQVYVEKYLNDTFSDSRDPNSEAIQQLIKSENKAIRMEENKLDLVSGESKNKDHHVAVSLRGPHGTDIIGGILECCSMYNCKILDFSLSRLHHNVVFGVFLSITGEFIDLYNSLVKTARIWDGELTFDVQSSNLQLKQVANGREYRLEEAPYTNRAKYVATVLSQNGLSSLFLDKFLKWLLLKKISVEKMKRLDQAVDLRCIEFILSVPAEINSNDLIQEIIMFSTQYKADVAFQPHDVFWRQKRLVVFDMDSTLIQQEVIDEIARHSGIVDQVSEITELAMQGKIDFKESLSRRVGLLKGTPTSVLKTIQGTLTFTDGAHQLCKALKAAGFRLAVISGGFIPLAKYVKNELGLDYAFANQLETTNDGAYLTGKTVGPIVDAERKAELLEVIAQAEGISLSQVAAVGDGANDLKMLARASLGIAFNAKSKVQEQARVRINQSSLINVLYLMGYSEKESIELQNST